MSHGDFNGDGKTDFVLVFVSQLGLANIDVALSDGGKFNAMSRWATEQGEYRWVQQWVTGDFNGVGTSDIGSVNYDAGYASFNVHMTGYPPKK